MDGSYVTPDGKEISFFTLHLYLNDAETTAPGEKPLIGGATTFSANWGWGSEYDVKGKLDVAPKVGRVLLFQHRNLPHCGEEVHQGVKYTMRTDLMYAMEKKPAEDTDGDF